MHVERGKRKKKQDHSNGEHHQQEGWYVCNSSVHVIGQLPCLPPSLAVTLIFFFPFSFFFFWVRGMHVMYVTLGNVDM